MFLLKVLQELDPESVAGLLIRETLMYTCIHGVYMWEAEPRLFWRVKINGKWTWRKALTDQEGKVLPPKLEVNESD